MPLFFGPLRNFVNFMLAIPSLQHKQLLEVPLRLWLSKYASRGYQVTALCFCKKPVTEGTLTDDDVTCSSDSDGKLGTKRAVAKKGVQLSTTTKLQNETSKPQSFCNASATNELSVCAEAESATSASAESSPAATVLPEIPKEIEAKSTPTTAQTPTLPPSLAAAKPPINPSVATQPSVLEAKNAQQQNPKQKESKIAKFWRRRSSRSKCHNRKRSKSAPAEVPKQNAGQTAAQRAPSTNQTAALVQQPTEASTVAAQPPTQDLDFSQNTQQKTITTPTECGADNIPADSAECSNVELPCSDTESSTEMESECVCETMSNMDAPCQPMANITIPKDPRFGIVESESDCEPSSNAEIKLKADESESDCESPVESSGIYPKDNESICGTWEPQKPLKQISHMHAESVSTASKTSIPEAPMTGPSETLMPTSVHQQRPPEQELPKGALSNTQPVVQKHPTTAASGTPKLPPPRQQQIPKKEAKRRKFWQRQSTGSKTSHIHSSDPSSNQGSAYSQTPAQKAPKPGRSKPAKQKIPKSREASHRQQRPPMPQMPEPQDYISLGSSNQQDSKQGKKSSGPHEPLPNSSVHPQTPQRHDPETYKQKHDLSQSKKHRQSASAGSTRETSKQRKSSDSRYLPDYSKCSKKKSAHSHTPPSHLSGKKNGHKDISGVPKMQPGQNQPAAQDSKTDNKTKDRKRFRLRKKGKPSHTSLGPYLPDSKQPPVGPKSPKERSLPQQSHTHQKPMPSRTVPSKQKSYPPRTPQHENRSLKQSQPPAQGSLHAQIPKQKKPSKKRSKIWKRSRSKSPPQKDPHAHAHPQNQGFIQSPRQFGKEGISHSQTSIQKQHKPSKHEPSHSHPSMGSPSTQSLRPSTPKYDKSKGCYEPPKLRLKQCVPNKPQSGSFSHTESESATDSDCHSTCESMMKTRFNQSEAACRALMEENSRRDFNYKTSESESECESSFKLRKHESDSQSPQNQKPPTPIGPSQHPEPSVHSHAIKQPKQQKVASKPPPKQKPPGPIDRPQAPKDKDASQKRPKAKRRSFSSKTRKQKVFSPGQPQISAPNEPQATPAHSQLSKPVPAKPQPSTQKQNLPVKTTPTPNQPMNISVPSRDTATVCFGPPKMRKKSQKESVSSSLEHTDTGSGTESDHHYSNEAMGTPSIRMSESESECEFSMQKDNKMGKTESDSDCELSSHIKSQPKQIQQPSKLKPKQIQIHKETSKQKDPLSVSSEPLNIPPSQATKKEIPEKGSKFWKKISYRSKYLKKKGSLKKQTEIKKTASTETQATKPKSSSPVKSETSQKQTQTAPAPKPPSNTQTTTDTKPPTSSTEPKKDEEKMRVCSGPPKMRSKPEQSPEALKKPTPCSDNESGTDSGTECGQQQPKSNESNAPCTKSEFAGICAEAYKTDADAETSPKKECSDDTAKKTEFSGVCAEAFNKDSNPNQKKNESDSDCDRNKK